MRLKAGEAIASACDVRVTVDGLELALCVEADEDEGWADVIALNDRGGAIVDNDSGGVVLTRWRGRVRIHFT